MTTSNRCITAAWGFLVGATLFSFWLTGYLSSQIAVIAACMALTSAKVIIVLRRFMELNRLTTPFQIFFYIWTFGCAAMITGIAWLSN